MGFIADIFFGGAEEEAAEIQAGAAREAGQTQLQSAREVINMLEGQQRQARADLAPYRRTGYDALAAQANAMGLPGYVPVDGDVPELSQAPDPIMIGNQPVQVGGFGGTVPGFRGGGQFPAAWFPSGALARAVPRGRTFDQAGNVVEPEFRTVEPTGDYGGFRESPGYQFRLDEMQRALDARNAATGSFYSGKPMRELARYTAGLADQEFGDYYNRLASLSGTGQTASTNVANLGAQAARGGGNVLLSGASDYGNALLNAGASRASGVLGSAQAKRGTLTDLATAFLL